MDLEHATLAWCVKFAGQITYCIVIGADGHAAFQPAFQRKCHPRAIPSSRKKQVQIIDKLLDGTVSGIKEGSEKFIIGLLCVVCRTVKRRPCENAADPVFKQQS